MLVFLDFFSRIFLRRLASIFLIWLGSVFWLRLFQKCQVKISDLTFFFSSIEHVFFLIKNDRLVALFSSFHNQSPISCRPLNEFCFESFSLFFGFSCNNRNLIKLVNNMSKLVGNWVSFFIGIDQNAIRFSRNNMIQSNKFFFRYMWCVEEAKNSNEKTRIFIIN